MSSDSGTLAYYIFGDETGSDNILVVDREDDRVYGQRSDLGARLRAVADGMNPVHWVP